MDRGSGGIPLPFHLQHNVHPQLFAQLPDMRPTKPQLSNLIMHHQQHQQPQPQQPITAHTSDDEDSRMGPGSGKASRGKRKKVNHACLYCRRSHMTCDEGRPCQRCIKREIGHLCHDDYKPISTRPRDKSPVTADGSASGSATPAILPPTPAQPDDVQQQNTTQPPTPAQQAFPVNAPLGYVMPTALPMQPQQPTLSQATTTPNWPLYPSQFAATAAATGLEGFGNEFADLTSILDNLDDPFFFNAPSFGQFPYPPSSLAPGVPMQGQQQQPVAVEATTTAANDIQMDDVPMSAPSSPGVSVLPTPSKAEKFFLAAADLPTGSKESRLNRVIHAKYEAGLLKPYNYATGYARLSRWMDRSLSAKARAQILQPLGVLRPKFREVALSLTDMDLVFTEEAFERLLLDYDRVFSVMGVPACLWRRTGEIYKANREFAELIGVEGHMLRDGRLCIYELMAEESAVNYWQKFGQVAFDPEHKAVLTSCVLRYAPTVNAQGHVISHQTHAPAGMLPPPSVPTTPHTAFAARRDVLGLSGGSVIGLQDTPRREDRHIHCCCSFTIRRDEKGIPSVIVGNFIKY